MASRALLDVAICLVVSEGALPPAYDSDYLGPDIAADAGASPGVFDRDHFNPAAADAGAFPGALDSDHVSPPTAAGTQWPAMGWGIPGSVRDNLIQANKALADNERMKAFTAAYSAERGRLLSNSRALVERAEAVTKENAELKGEVESLKAQMRLMNRSLRVERKAERELRSSIRGLQDEKADLLQRNGEEVQNLRATQKELRGQKSQSDSLTLQMRDRDMELTAQVQELQGQMATMAAQARKREEGLQAQIAKENQTIHDVWQENTKLRDSNDVLMQNNLKLRKMVGTIKGMADDLSRAA